MYYITSDTIGQAHGLAVKRVMDHGTLGTTEDGEMVRELIEPLCIHVMRPLADPMCHKNSPYTGRFLGQYTRQVLTACDSGFTDSGFAYTYGNRFRNWRGIDQLDRTIAKLVAVPQTRRAIMHTWDVEKDIGCNYVPCLQTVQFQSRDGILNTVATFRSNDMLSAWGCNAYALAEMIKIVARSTTCAVGYLETISTNAHIYYERDASNLEKMLG